jgi:glycogen synthase
MKILIISNIYPPPPVGGYEQLCQDVASDLERRGHDLHILTSSYERKKPCVEGKVHRLLALDRNFYSYRTKGALASALINRGALARTIAAVRPDLLYVWNMENLDRPLLHAIKRCTIPSVYHLSAPWILWPDRLSELCDLVGRVSVSGFVSRLLRPLLDRMHITYDCSALAIERASFSCSALQKEVAEAGITVRHGEVILEGIPLSLFPARDFDSYAPEGVEQYSLVYAGQLVRHKGVHTAVLAAAQLVNRYGVRNFHLTVIGPGEAEYSSYLRSLVDEHGIAGYVSFRPPVPRSDLGLLLSKSQVLLFPSIWEEPWSLVLLQGMASGLAVVGTATGGSREVLVNEENSLTFPPDDEESMAAAIARLLKSPQLIKKLARNAQDLVRANYSIESMVDKIEQQLSAALSERAGRG